MKNPLDLIVFKSPSKIDWKETNKAVVKWIEEHPDTGSPSENAMWRVDLMLKLRKSMRRIGVKNFYKYQQNKGKEISNEQAG